MKKITERQRDALRRIELALATNIEPSYAWLANEMGIARTTAQRFIEALCAAGALEKPQVVGSWKLTRSGKKELRPA